MQGSWKRAANTWSSTVSLDASRGRYISKRQDELYNVVQATARVYVDNLRVCAKGRKKLTRLQIERMAVIRSVLHEHPAADSIATV